MTLTVDLHHHVIPDLAQQPFVCVASPYRSVGGGWTTATP
jgi:hypothetical protein